MNKKKKAFEISLEGFAFHNGGVGGFRTLARVTPSNDLANRPLQPLEYHSMAERVGFEPTVPFGITGFQDRLLKPLGHLSVPSIIARVSLFCQDFPIFSYTRQGICLV